MLKLEILQVNGILPSLDDDFSIYNEVEEEQLGYLQDSSSDFIVWGLYYEQHAVKAPRGNKPGLIRVLSFRGEESGEATRLLFWSWARR